MLGVRVEVNTTDALRATSVMAVTLQLLIMFVYVRAMQINGIAHVQLSVSDIARSRQFWRPLFELFEMAVIYDDDSVFYGVGGRTGLCLSVAAPEHRGERFVQRRVGLHHPLLSAP